MQYNIHVHVVQTTMCIDVQTFTTIPIRFWFLLMGPRGIEVMITVNMKNADHPRTITSTQKTCGKTVKEEFKKFKYRDFPFKKGRMKGLDILIKEFSIKVSIKLELCFV